MGTVHAGVRVIYLPDPTWANHNKIFPAGGIEVRKYRYYLPKTRGLDYEVRHWKSRYACAVNLKVCELWKGSKSPYALIHNLHTFSSQGLIQDLGSAQEGSIVVRLSDHAMMCRDLSLSATPGHVCTATMPIVQASMYLSWSSRMLDIADDLEACVQLLHACAHNPTGVDPTLDQWKVRYLSCVAPSWLRASESHA